MRDAWGQGAKSFPVFGSASCANGKEGATMKCLIKSNNFVLVTTKCLKGTLACQLQGGFVGISTRVAKKYPFSKSYCAQFLRQL